MLEVAIGAGGVAISLGLIKVIEYLVKQKNGNGNGVKLLEERHKQIREDIHEVKERSDKLCDNINQLVIIQTRLIDKIDILIEKLGR